ncbi:MAG TPA: HupE/UreJ family protein [Micropepsaceae bacterium]|nr:HupE/UreJ family protein [Micropepsaceae bacterium]
MASIPWTATVDFRRMAYCLAALAVAFAGPLPGFGFDALAHGMAGKDADFVAHSVGPQILPFFYLGAKHMATGYDHLLFVIGTVFFLYQLRHVAIYVTTFSIGHSTTLLLGVLGGVHVNPFLVDAVIGLSVAYIAFDNLGGFKTLLGVQPNTKLAILIFGLVHGFGLATKVQELNPSRDGLAANMISFNVGVEIGQLLVLSVALVAIVWWRKTAAFSKQAVFANAAIMAAGFALMEYQLAGYFVSGGA